MPPTTHDDFIRLLGEQRPPCVSIYLATPQTYPDRQQGPTRYSNLVDRAEELLHGEYPGTTVRGTLDRFRALADEGAFWERRQPGLAVLGSTAMFDTFDLRQPPAERVFVADSFYVLPLLRAVQSADRFHVLCLQRERIGLYEGNRDGLEAIKPVGVPRTVTDALGEAVTVQRKEHAHAGKSPGEPRPAPRGPNVPPGHPATRDDAKLDAERFFRAIDRAVWEQVSRPSGLPLVLVALPEQQAIFRSVSHNPQLLKAGVERGPGDLPDRQLLEEVWRCVEEEHRAQVQKQIENFNVARPRGLASDDLNDTARAAHAGRVGFLMVESERVVPGRIDADTGAIQSEADGPESGELLNDLAGLVLRRKGDVMVVPAERMPTKTGLAAVLRF